MIYQDQFRDEKTANVLIKLIQKVPLKKSVNIMEVCGTHTHAAARFGIRSILPPEVRLISGPGCPVCVTSGTYVDQALYLAAMPNVIITTFGDMFRVPGSDSSLQRLKAEGAQVRVVYSPRDALKIAGGNPDKTIVFLGVGFETTAPLSAAAILEAEESGLDNFCILAGFKTLPNALEALAQLPGLKVDGFLCPGHLSVITGLGIYEDFVKKHKIPCVVAGFELLDVLEGIRLLLEQISEGKAEVKNEYTRAVRPQGNPKAAALLNKVFEPVDSHWRGIGVIPGSGLAIRKEYSLFDAEKRFNLPRMKWNPPKGCVCGEILIGAKTPPQCPSFGKVCTPENPLGACMVSSEGTCAAYYRFRKPAAV